LQYLLQCSDLLGRPQWVCSSWISSVEASWVIFRLKLRWAPILGGPKIGWSPRTQGSEINTQK
jgi:hypothetical protein